ncbi:MAG: 5-formyltetrahydrofolate cyclo-ligase [Flavobacteriaceae bacterium]|nr:5-formyltetrahydrofolate cyclo-ligase [Flavobacteriaceae bacterium]
MLKQRSLLDATEKKLFDTAICKTLQELIVKKKCKVVHAFLPMGNEINIIPLLTWLLAQQITVVTPKTLPKRQLQHLVLNSLDALEKGVFGTSHPANSVEYTGNYDIIIVPGLAFDTDNYRLGYGGGYYDTFLAEHPTAFTVGIGYPFQQIDVVPKEKHDVYLDVILSKELI